MEIRDLKEKIESLQAQLVSLREAQVTHYCANCEDMAARLEVVQRRERAAVEDLNLTANCDVCKHYDADEISCEKPTVDSYSCFEWRGPQEAGEGEAE